MKGLTLARAVAMSAVVSGRIVATWPMWMHTSSTRLHNLYRAQRRGWYLSVIYLDEHLVAAEIPIEADLKEDNGSDLAFEGVRVRSGVGWCSSGVDDVWGAARFIRRQDVEVFL